MFLLTTHKNKWAIKHFSDNQFGFENKTENILSVEEFRADAANLNEA